MIEKIEELPIEIESTTTVELMDSKESTESIVSVHVLIDRVTDTNSAKIIIIFTLITVFTFIASISILVTLDKLFVSKTCREKLKKGVEC